MTEEIVGHVPAVVLWQCLCGGRELRQPQYEHVTSCPACEALAAEITEALDEIARAFAIRDVRVS